MVRLPFCFLFLVIALVFTPAASAAVDITFADLQIVKGVHILIYNNTGDYVGEYNTTSSVTLDETQSYIFVLKPTDQSWFTDPMQSIELLKAYLPVVISYLLYAVVAVGIGFLISRIWK